MTSVTKAVRTVKTPKLPPDDDDFFRDYSDDGFWPPLESQGPIPREPRDVVWVEDYDPCGRRDDRPVLIVPRRDP